MTILREAGLSDIPALHDVRVSVRENALSDPGRITPAMYADHLAGIGKGWLCEIDGRVVGFSVAARPDASIWALFVHPDFEGRGIGKVLLKKAVDWLASEGAERVVLGTAVGTRADAFYAKQGWIRGEIKPDGEVVYALSLVGRPRDDSE